MLAICIRWAARAAERGTCCYHLRVFKIGRLRPDEGRLFVVVSIIVGVVAGSAVVLYHFFLESIFHAIYSAGAQNSPLWKRLVFPTLGAFFGGALLLRWRGARGSGVNQMRIALIVHDAVVSVRGTIGKFLASGIAIGCGLPLGPEDPAVHIGGGTASGLGRLLGLSKKRLQLLIPVGAAAGLAAAFNTPITAVIFTLEEIVGDINAPMLGSTVLAAVISVMIRRAALGGAPLFTVPQYTFTRATELVFFALLGLLGGLVSAAFTRLLLFLRSQLGRVRRPWIFDPVTVMGGIIAGGFALVAPGILGAGYSWIDDALNGNLVLRVLVLLFACKFFATAFTFASGNSGGLFAPSLYVGAMLGGVVGTLARMYFPAYVGQPGTYVLVGMGVTFAGIIRAPITSIFMIFEVTQDYQVMLPVMVANVTAYAIANALSRESLFDALAQQDGIRLPSKEDRQLKMLTNAEAMRQPSMVLDANELLEQAVRKVSSEGAHAFVVLDQGGLTGVVTKSMLAQGVSDGKQQMPVRELAKLSDGYISYPDESLALSLEKLRQGAVLLPIVSRLNPAQLLGVVEAQDVLKAYRIASFAQTTLKTVNPEAREATLDKE